MTVYTVTTPQHLLISGTLHDDGHVTAPEWCGDTTALTWHETRVNAWRDAYNTAQAKLYAAHEAFHTACSDNMLLAAALLKEEIKDAIADRMD